MGVLLTILIVILGYYVLILLGRLALPWLRAYAQRKTEAHFREFFSGGQAETPEEKPEGSVTIENRRPKKKPAKEPVGEYIEFEEID